MGEKRLSFFFSFHGKEAKSSLDSQALFACKSRGISGEIEHCIWWANGWSTVRRFV